MLRHQPVNSLCLSFPRDKVSLLSPDREMCLEGPFCESWENNNSKNRSRSSLVTNHHPLASLRELSKDQPLDRSNFGKFQVNRLVGSRDSSDRFAIHLKLKRHLGSFGKYDEAVLMVDSCRGEITQVIRNGNFGGLTPSISSNLDTMACFTTVEDVDDDDDEEEKCISIYDVSRHRTSYDVEPSKHDYSYEYLSGKKRHQFHSNDDDLRDGDEGGSSLLRRLSPKVNDMYGIQSSITCMTIDEYGETIACGTSDGDIFVFNGSDLGGFESK